MQMLIDLLSAPRARENVTHILLDMDMEKHEQQQQQQQKL